MKSTDGIKEIIQAKKLQKRADEEKRPQAQGVYTAQKHSSVGKMPLFI